MIINANSASLVLAGLSTCTKLYPGNSKLWSSNGILGFK